MTLLEFTLSLIFYLQKVIYVVLGGLSIQILSLSGQNDRQDSKMTYLSSPKQSNHSHFLKDFNHHYIPKKLYFCGCN
jgi:hypothetical protein